jgi:hypothetical protein
VALDDGITGRTETSILFGSLKACIADAKLHGFDEHIAAESDAFPQSSYTVQVFEDGTVTVSPGA